MVDTLVDKAPLWLAGEGPEAAVAVLCQGRIARNLSDFPFPGQCSDDEKRDVEERVLAALEGAGLLATGRYCSLLTLDRKEALLLAERHLTTPNLLEGTGPHGVYLSEDQGLGIMVNGEDHVCLQANAAGLQFQEVWSRLSVTDDALAEALDYAFDEKLGYLTAAVGSVGTACRFAATLHLPALAMANKLAAIHKQALEQRHTFQALHGGLTEATGDLFQLANRATLGRSEEEIIYHVRHQATAIIRDEKAARDALLAETPLSVDDRVGGGKCRRKAPLNN